VARCRRVRPRIRRSCLHALADIPGHAWTGLPGRQIHTATVPGRPGPSVAGCRTATRRPRAGGRSEPEPGVPARHCPARCRGSGVTTASDMPSARGPVTACAHVRAVSWGRWGMPTASRRARNAFWKAACASVSSPVSTPAVKDTIAAQLDAAYFLFWVSTLHTRQAWERSRRAAVVAWYGEQTLPAPLAEVFQVLLPKAPTLRTMKACLARPLSCSSFSSVGLARTSAGTGRSCTGRGRTTGTRGRRPNAARRRYGPRDPGIHGEHCCSPCSHSSSCCCSRRASEILEWTNRSHRRWAVIVFKDAATSAPRPASRSARRMIRNSGPQAARHVGRRRVACQAQREGVREPCRLL